MCYDFWNYFLKNGRRKLSNYNQKNNLEIRIIREKTRTVQEIERLGLFLRKTLRESFERHYVRGQYVNILKGEIKIGTLEPSSAGLTNGGHAIRAKMCYDFWNYFLKTGRRKLSNYNQKNNLEIRIIREKTRTVQEIERLRLFLRKTLRESFERHYVRGQYVNILKGKIKIGTLEPMSPPTAVVRLSMDLKGWNGSSLSDMLSNREKNDIRAGKLKFGSLKLNGVDVNPDLVKEVNLESSKSKRVGGPELEDENSPQEATPADASTSQPRRKRERIE
ncbi:hypothetical protein Q1695_003563 [Nippostrongylus brasiliensis]|nr:hypothetical protein Q1695_003563 [Nippostrongylus brasiliensis]